jgi:hypothetical protein
MKELKYDNVTLKLISDLSKICKTKENNYPIKIVKDESGIHIKAGNAGRSVVFTLDAPSSCFDFEGSELCFYDYNDFYNYATLFDSAVINQGTIGDGRNEVEALIITEGKRKISYPLSDAEVIKGSLKNVKWATPAAKFVFTSDKLALLSKALKFLSSKENKITFDFSGSEVTITASTELNKNSYQDIIELDSEVDEAFSITISDEVIKYLISIDYRVEVQAEGFIRFFFDVKENSASILATPKGE